MDTSVARTTREGLTAYARGKLERLAGCVEESLATGDAEAIHGLRVASRRIHEPLTVASAWIGRGEYKAARRGLKRLRAAFREVRDLDVLLHTLTTSPAGGGLTGDDLAELETRLTERRARGLTAAERACRELKPKRLLGSLDRLFETFSSRHDGEEVLLRRLDDRLRELGGRLFDSRPQPDGDADLHMTRIQVKRMRYCAESGLHAAALPTGPLIDALTEMQNHLGQWNDQLTAVRWLARIARRRNALAHRSAWSARLLHFAAERAQAADAMRERVLQDWGGLESALEPWRMESAEEAVPAPPAEAARSSFAAAPNPWEDARHPPSAGIAIGPAGDQDVREDVNRERRV